MTGGRIHRVFHTHKKKQILGGGGGGVEWPHEAGDRYWQVAAKTGLTVPISTNQ